MKFSPAGADLNEVPEMAELAEDMEKHRLKQLEELKRQYTQIGPLLMKVEELVVNTNTGRSPRMASYYAHWEQQIFGALNKMVLATLGGFLQLITPRKEGEGGAYTGSKSFALFKVSAMLSAPEVHVSPPLPEINKVLAKIVKSVVESTHNFVRWMHGSCLETPPQTVTEDEDPYVFSFFNEITANPEVVALVSLVTRTIAKTFGRVNKHLDAYRRYDQLWKMDKQQQMAKFEQKSPDCVMFDTRLQSYSRVVVEMDAMEPSIEVDFIAIGVSTLLHDIAEHARLDRRDHDADEEHGRENLVRMVDEIAAMSAALDPDTLDDLKEILNLVAEIRRRSMETELEFLRLMEWTRTLMYGAAIPPDEAEMVDGLAKSWAKLVEKAVLTDRSLGRVKAQFTLVTKGQVTEFQAEVKEMHEKYTLKGPGTGGPDLDQGLELMEEYTALLAKLNKTREELGEALKLFNLPIVAYPELAEVSASIAELSQIYALYAEIKAQREDWAAMLWADLDIATIEKGMEEFDGASRSCRSSSRRCGRTRRSRSRPRRSSRRCRSSRTSRTTRCARATGASSCR